MNKALSSQSKFKIALLIFLPLFIVTSIVLWAFYYLEMKSKKNILQIQASQTIKLQKHRIADNFNLVVSDILFFANYSQLIDMLDNPDVNRPLTNDLALFSRGAKIYDQVRVINADGKESIRINFIPGKGPVIVREENLQSKKERYYFQDTFRLQKGEIFVSPLDLNIEHGHVEKPLKPMIRFGTPIFDREGKKRGIIIFNYLAAHLIKEVKDLAELSSIQCIMLNSDGYWLISEHPSKLEWGFMFQTGKDLTIKVQKPAIWQKIIKEDSSQFSSGKRLYTFTTIYPLKESWKSSTGSGQAFAPSLTAKKAKNYFWKIVLCLPEDLWTAGYRKIQIRYMLFSLIAFIALAIVAFRVAGAKLTENQAVKSLQQAHANLENKVKERTEELVKTNEVLLIEIDDRKQTEGKLQESEKKYRILFENANDAIFVAQDNVIKFSNQKTKELTGYSSEELIKIPFVDLIHPDDKAKVIDRYKRRLIGEKPVSTYAFTIINKSGMGKIVQLNSVMIQWEEKPATLNFFRDITQQVKIESQLQQAQKMEAIGTLAGGIAHDFNNILFPILGHAEMLLQDIPESSPFRKGLNGIYAGALRAKDLVKQILTFSRQESNELTLMKIHPIVKEALKLIRSSIPTTIDIKLDIDPACGLIKADPTQIHQIIMNLATNAYHAMESLGGELQVILKEVKLGEHDIIIPDMTSGIYACLTVADTGVGMDKNLTEKIFDPFFTTKEKGRGTGMGLSVVHGIVKNLGGAIHVYSEPDKGTEFKVYFPIEKSSVKKQRVKIHETIQGGIEHILLVDDEDTIITMEKQMLERMGYQVTSCSNSIEALQVFRDNPAKFNLVITDMAMPNMPGDKLSTELGKIRPDVPILLCTGFSEIMSEEKAASLGIKDFILKPIVMMDLAQKIRKVLDEK